MPSFIDLTGQRFGRWTVIDRGTDHFTKSGTRITMWNCVCDCGNRKEVSANSLKRGASTSCGCYSTEVKSKLLSSRNTKNAKMHGASRERLFHVWKAIKHRCYNTNDEYFYLYGGRGIKMCDEWQEDYTEFRTWALSHGYDPNAHYGQCTIDRINVNGNYEPDNCRWVDFKTQANNRRPRKRDTA